MLSMRSSFTLPAGVWPGQLAISGTCMPRAVVEPLPPSYAAPLNCDVTRAARAVVAKEEDERVVAEAELVHLADEAADELVHVGDHVGEVLAGLRLPSRPSPWDPSRGCRASADTGRA